MRFITNSRSILLQPRELVIKFNRAGNKTQASVLSPANGWLINIVIPLERTYLNCEPHNHMEHETLKETEGGEEQTSWLSGWMEGYDEVMQPLFADLHHARCCIYQTNHVFYRRVYVRCVFATIEADVFQRKRLALSGHGKSYTYSEDELAVLREVQYSARQNGTIKKVDKFIPLPTNYRLSYRLAAKVIKSPFVLDCSGKEWQAFLQAIQIRHRITHPKTGSDIIVSKEDAELVADVSDWCHQNAPDFLLAAIPRDNNAMNTKPPLGHTN